MFCLPTMHVKVPTVRIFGFSITTLGSTKVSKRAGRTGFEPVLQAPEACVLSWLDHRPRENREKIKERFA